MSLFESLGISNIFGNKKSIKQNKSELPTYNSWEPAVSLEDEFMQQEIDDYADFLEDSNPDYHDNDTV